MTKSVEFTNLKIKIDEEPKQVTYIFAGDVDEHFKQEKVPRIRKEKIVFHLAEVNNFNSCGIREWIHLVQEFSKIGHLVFKECSVTMIDQINMVPGSLGMGEIESFYAPYYCECGGEVNRLVNMEQAKPYLINHTAPEMNCTRCGKPLEFDALEESYFLFANTLPNAG